MRSEILVEELEIINGSMVTTDMGVNRNADGVASRELPDTRDGLVDARWDFAILVLLESPLAKHGAGGRNVTSDRVVASINGLLKIFSVPAVDLSVV